MSGRDVIVVGASAGGVEALKILAGGLPAGLPAAVFVVLHMAPAGPDVLPEILSRYGPLPASAARDGEPVEPARIYVGVPDYDLLLVDDRVRVVAGAQQNRYRPAVDLLFSSAARTYGPRVVGVVLTGALDDGTAGLSAIKAHGGTTVVQDPEEALFPGMPRSALAQVAVDHCLPLRLIPRLLARLARRPAAAETPAG